MSARFTQDFTALAEHIDELGHVNNAVWVRWIQEIAVAHWEAVAPPEHLAAHVWVVTRHEIDYRGNVRAGETVTGETWVPAPPKGARFDRHVRFTGDDGKVSESTVEQLKQLDIGWGYTNTDDAFFGLIKQALSSRPEPR